MTAISAVDDLLDAWTRGPADAVPALFSDFDGTLVGFTDNPADVWLPAHLREALVEIETAGTPVGIVSGRRLVDLRVRTGLPPEVYHAGTHGLEISHLDEHWLHPALADVRPRLQAVLRTLRQMVPRYPTVWLEDKGYAIVVHTRLASVPVREAAEQAVEALLAPDVAAGRLKLQGGYNIVEILPPVEWDKGNAVERIVGELERSLGRPILPVFFGDDVTDEHALAWVEPRGIAVAVGPRPSVASWRLPGPRAVEEFVVELANRVTRCA